MARAASSPTFFLIERQNQDTCAPLPSAPPFWSQVPNSSPSVNSYLERTQPATTGQTLNPSMGLSHTACCGWKGGPTQTSLRSPAQRRPRAVCLVPRAPGKSLPSLGLSTICREDAGQGPTQLRHARAGVFSMPVAACGARATWTPVCLFHSGQNNQRPLSCTAIFIVCIALISPQLRKHVCKIRFPWQAGRLKGKETV